MLTPSSSQNAYPLMSPFPQTISPTLLRPRNSFHNDTSINPRLSLTARNPLASTSIGVTRSTLIGEDSDQVNPQLSLLPFDHPLSHGPSTEPLRIWLTEDHKHFPFLNTSTTSTTAPSSSSHLNHSDWQGGNTLSQTTIDSNISDEMTCSPTSDPVSTPSAHRALHTQLAPTHSAPMILSPNYPVMPNPIAVHLSHRSASVQLDSVSRRLVYRPTSLQLTSPIAHSTSSESITVYHPSLPPLALGPLAPPIALVSPQPQRQNSSSTVAVLQLEQIASDDAKDDGREMLLEGSEEAEEAIEIELDDQFLPTPPCSAQFGHAKRQPANPIATVMALGESCSSSPEEPQFEGSDLPGVFAGGLATPRSPSPVSRNGRYPARLANIDNNTTSNGPSTRFSSSNKQRRGHHASKPGHLTNAKSKAKSNDRMTSGGKKRSSSSSGVASTSRQVQPQTPLRQISRWRSATSSRLGENKMMPTGPFLWAALHMLSLPRHSQWVTWDEESRTAYISDTQEFAENVYSLYCASNQWTSFQRNMTNYQGWGYKRFAVEGSRLRQQRIYVPTIDDLCKQWVERGHDARSSDAARKDYLEALGSDEVSATDDSDGTIDRPATGRRLQGKSKGSKAPKMATVGVDPSIRTRTKTIVEVGDEPKSLLIKDDATENRHPVHPHTSRMFKKQIHPDPNLLEIAGSSFPAPQSRQTPMSPESEEGCGLVFSPNAFTPSPNFLHPSLPLSSARTADFTTPPQAAYPTPHTSSSFRNQGSGWSS
ncbi:hypothetical protein IAT40_002869 [Kwoniella sp. CBS 6097]